MTHFTDIVNLRPEITKFSMYKDTKMFEVFRTFHMEWLLLFATCATCGLSGKIDNWL